MDTIIKIFSMLLLWVIVPLIMFSLIVFGKIIGNKTKDKDKKTSANAGWWAGLILFVFFFIYHLSDVSNPQIRMTTISISIFAGLVGCILGFALLWFLKSLIQERTVGILTLILSCSGSISLFSYFFIRNIYNFLMSAALGLIFGTLMHIVIFPKSGHNLFND